MDVYLPAELLFLLDGCHGSPTISLSVGLICALCLLVGLLKNVQKLKWSPIVYLIWNDHHHIECLSL